MFTSKLLRLGLLHRATGSLHVDGSHLKASLPRVIPSCCSFMKQRSYATAADNAPPPRWVQLEPELDEALVPRKLSVSPLESWLSLRYSLPPVLEALPEEEAELLEEKVLPPGSVPVLEDGSGSATPLSCRNVLKIRRRKMNRHKYKKAAKEEEVCEEESDGEQRKKETEKV